VVPCANSSTRREWALTRAMTPDQFDQLVKDDVLRKRLAKWMARLCFRENTKLEGFHDRISDAEMMELMIGVVDNCLSIPFDTFQQQSQFVVDRAHGARRPAAGME
jgi:hypothetical protein